MCDLHEQDPIPESIKSDSSPNVIRSLFNLSRVPSGFGFPFFGKFNFLVKQLVSVN